jgi:hypothetical protein
MDYAHPQPDYASQAQKEHLYEIEAKFTCHHPLTYSELIEYFESIDRPEEFWAPFPCKEEYLNYLRAMASEVVTCVVEEL